MSLVILIPFLLLVVFVDMVAMAIAYEIESKNKDLDLKVLSVTMRETRVTDMVKREKARLALKSWTYWLYYRKNFA